MKNKLKNLYLKLKLFFNNPKVKKTISMITLLIFLCCGLLCCCGLCSYGGKSITASADELEENDFYIQELPIDVNPVIQVTASTYVRVDSTCLVPFAMPKVQLYYDTIALGYTHFRVVKPYIDGDLTYAFGMPIKPIQWDYSDWISFDEVSSLKEIVVDSSIFYLTPSWGNFDLILDGKIPIIEIDFPITINVSGWSFGYYANKKYLPTDFGFNLITNDVLNYYYNNNGVANCTTEINQTIGFKSSPRIQINYAIFGSDSTSIGSLALSLYAYDVILADELFRLTTIVSQDHDFINGYDYFKFGCPFVPNVSTTYYYELIGDLVNIQSAEFDRGYDTGYKDGVDYAEIGISNKLTDSYNRGKDYGYELGFKEGSKVSEEVAYEEGYKQCETDNRSTWFDEGVQAGIKKAGSQKYWEGYEAGAKSHGVSIFGSITTTVDSLLNTPLFGGDICLKHLFAVGIGVVLIRAFIKICFGG